MMAVSSEEAMQMFKQDLSHLMDHISGMLAHYQISDWEAYVFFRKPECPESNVLEYEAKAGDEFAKQIVALHAGLSQQPTAPTLKGE